MRFRERAGGIAFIWLGSLFLASAAPSRTSAAAAVVAGCIGAAAGLVLWAVRRPGTYLGERAGSRIFDRVERVDRVDRVGDLTGRARTRIVIVVVVWTALVFVAALVLRAFGVSVLLVLIGGAGWVAGGVQVLLAAPMVARDRRESFQGDLHELATMPDPARHPDLDRRRPHLADADTSPPRRARVVGWAART
jgi:hypothetical protein